MSRIIPVAKRTACWFNSLSKSPNQAIPGEERKWTWQLLNKFTKISHFGWWLLLQTRVRIISASNLRGIYINRDSCQFGALYLHGKLILWTKLCFANFFAAMFWLYGDLLGSKAGLFCSLQRKHKSRKEFQKVSLQKDNLRQGKFNFFLHFRKKSILQAKKGFPWIFHSVSGIFAPKHIIGF